MAPKDSVTFNTNLTKDLIALLFVIICLLEGFVSLRKNGALIG